MPDTSTPEQQQPPQSQGHQPGRESEMTPLPQYMPRFKGADKLKGKVALITGGNSGIGRSIAVHMAREGADIAILTWKSTTMPPRPSRPKAVAA